MVGKLDDLQVINYFELVVREFILASVSYVDNWWKACIPPQIRDDIETKHKNAQKINNVLNKPDYDVPEYMNFDHYERIISRKDNWKNHFEDVFLDRPVFTYKMNVLLSLRNDISHGRRLDKINSTRLRLHCYDILSQIYESGRSKVPAHDIMAERLGLAENNT